MIELILSGDHLEKYQNFCEKHNKRHNCPETIDGRFIIIIIPSKLGNYIELTCRYCDRGIILQNIGG